MEIIDAALLLVTVCLGFFTVNRWVIHKSRRKNTESDGIDEIIAVKDDLIKEYLEFILACLGLMLAFLSINRLFGGKRRPKEAIRTLLNKMIEAL